MEWTRTNIGVSTCSYLGQTEAIRRSQLAIDEAVPYPQGPSPCEPRDEVQSAVDEEQVAHGLLLPDEERSPGEPEDEVPSAVDEGQAAHALPDEERSPHEPEAEVQPADEAQVARAL